MWERFSYYGMRALLMLYMINYFKWTQQDASSIYKWYSSLVYLTPLLGGFLADRYLGNKWAIIIGASLMAIGHFCMAFERIEIFYGALVFLILGNGLFKPNMSIQVGRLYSPNDSRRDAAYTIFYMGINLGAFLSPLVCGWLAVNTHWEYHAGFTAAGIGMVLGLVVYLVGLPWVREIAEESSGAAAADKSTKESDEHYMTEEEAATKPSVMPWLSGVAPTVLYALGVLCIVGSLALHYLRGSLPPVFAGLATPDNLVALALGGGFSSFMGGWIASQLSMAVRDRVLAIFFVAVFVVFFWAAFEQAGNAMNVYADKVTDRYVGGEAPVPSVYPEQPAPTGALSPIPTAWFQSINPFAIFLLAPLFAWLWVALPKRGINLSIPAKVSIGVFLQGVAFALMFWATSYENQPSSAALAGLPDNVLVDEQSRLVFHDAPNLSDDPDEYYARELEPEIVAGGRLVFDADAGKLNAHGVLSDTDRDRILRATASRTFLDAVRDLALKSETAAKEADGKAFTVEEALPQPPPGFDLRYAGFPEDELRYDAASGKLVATVALADKDFKQVLLSGADPGTRDALNSIYVTSAAFKVGVWWLACFYVLCTIGELCLSPVGLSMVSKLAPARFGTMLMGMWLLTSFFGNFMAGLAGENWGTMHPFHYFGITSAVLAGVAVICFVLVRRVNAMMHGVR